MRLRDSFDGEFAVAHVDAAEQRGLAAAGFFESVVSEDFDVALRDVGERLRGRARVGSGHVGDAVVDDAFFDEDWILVRGRA